MKIRYLWLYVSLVVWFVTVVLWFGIATPTQADIAPFQAMEGGALGPVFTTSVQMISETVLLELRDDLTFMVNGQDEYLQLGVQATADFMLRNPQTQTQVLVVGFPKYLPTVRGSGYIYINNLHAYVAGIEVSTRSAEMLEGTWQVWSMDLPPGDTLVRVVYDAPVYEFGQASLGYILHTGVAWAGPIGQADIVFRYPFVLEEMIFGGGAQPTGYQIKGNEARWHFDNLEPTVGDDIKATFIEPATWGAIVHARTAVLSQPNADNYLKLAEAYSAAIFPSHNFFSSPLVAQVAEMQYLKALALEPSNTEIRDAYINFIVWHAGGDLPAERWLDALEKFPDNGTLLTEFTFYFLSRGDELSPGTQATAIALLGQDPRAIAIGTATPTNPSASTPASAHTATASAVITATPRPSEAALPALSPTVVHLELTAVPTAVPNSDNTSNNATVFALICMIIGIGVIYLIMRRKV